jgi:uncharacterized metal-binding protein YceD (DUF177 family)
MHKKCPLNYYVELNDVRNEDEVTVDVTATPAECVELATRLKIPEVKSLTAHITLRKGLRPDLFDIQGQLKVKVVQECSVTLVPLDETVDETFYETLTTSESALAPKPDEEDSHQPVELIKDNRIDLGEIISQWVGLGLDPYPRSEETPLFQHVEVKTDQKTHNPFGILEGLKDK